jgi:hypothetical protein
LGAEFGMSLCCYGKRELQDKANDSSRRMIESVVVQLGRHTQRYSQSAGQF